MKICLVPAAVAVACALPLFSAASAQDTADIINPETGSVVSLTRAYWDANADIANREIQCDFHSYNATQGVFEETGFSGAPNTTSERSHSFFHQPLPDLPPHMNLAQVNGGTSGYGHIPLWGVDNGVYAGVAPLAESEYVEIVAHRSATNDAVRVWYPTNTPSYHVCYALDGEPFTPTGSAEFKTGYIQLPDFTFETTELEAGTEKPEFTNLETGEAVQITRGEWSYNKNIAFHLLNCRDVEWYDESQSYATAGFDNYSFYIYHPYNGGDSISYSRQNDGNVTNTYTRLIAEMDLPFTGGRFNGNGFGYGYMEQTDFGYRVWRSNIFYKECRVQKITRPSGSAYSHYGEHEYSEVQPLTLVRQLPLSMADCDYSDAGNYDGWGWSRQYLLGCPPANADIEESDTGVCDYSNANLFEGWGWNAATQTSCSPVEKEVVNSACDYSNADLSDGCGWNSVTRESCRPLQHDEVAITDVSSACDYSSADSHNGWGWNDEAQVSCAPIEEVTIEAGNCDYSHAALNGGWGWNAAEMRSCPPRL